MVLIAMKRLFLLPILLFVLSVSGQGQELGTAGTDYIDDMVYLYCDFEAGIPDGFTTYDRDGQTLYFTMIQAGFKQGDAWITKREEGLSPTNYYAASTSKYKYSTGETPQPADDWLVTKKIYVRGGNAVLKWKGRSICDQQKNKSSYQVMVSTTGNTPEDFHGEPVFSIDEEASNGWRQHEVSLAQFEGKEIYIAFVNNSLNKEILAIDNLEVKGGKGLCELTVNTGDHVYGTNAVSVDGTITAYSDVPVTEFKAYYTYQGKTFSTSVSGLSLRKHQSCSFSFDEKIPVAFGDTVKYKVWAEVNGQTQDTIDCQTVSFLFMPQRKTVVEEGTGMWCVYCPKGIVAMDILQKKYPEKFIGLALHYTDPLAVDDYVDALKFPGYPSGWFNRKYLCADPMVLVENDGVSMYTTTNGGFESYFLAAEKEPTLADITLTAHVENGKIKTEATSRFAINIDEADYQLAFALTEDNVTDPTYYQDNGFAGGDALLGGYESQPKRITAPIFNHVARGIYDDYLGVPGSIPTQLVAGESYKFEYTIDVPTSIKSLANSRLIAMLLDRKTGEIVNANTVELLASGIENVKTDEPSLTFHSSGNDCCIDFKSASTSPVSIRVYRCDGTTVATRQTDRLVTDGVYCRIPMNGKSGVFVVTATQDNKTVARKFSFF